MTSMRVNERAGGLALAAIPPADAAKAGAMAFDRTRYSKGMQLVGGTHPAATKDHGPTTVANHVIYGTPLKRRPLPKTDFAEISRRIDADQ